MSIWSKTLIKAVALPKALVRAQAAGEFVSALGGNARSVDIAQRGVARGLLKHVKVYGVDSSGVTRDQAIFSVDEDNAGEVAVDLSGKKSALEALDKGLAKSVVYAAKRMEQKGLKADVYYVFADSINADPAVLAAGRVELDIWPASTPPWAADEEPKSILKVTPGKDPGMSVLLRRGFKKGL